MIHATRLVVIAVLIGVSGCRGPEPRAGGGHASSAPSSRPAASESERAGGVAALRQRAERLWEARQRDDYVTVHEFLDPRQTGGAGKADQYVEWARANEPFKYESFALGRVEVEGRLGWVEVTQKVSVRKYPGAPANELTRWENWHVVEDRWVLVPAPEVELLPSAPSIRDRAAEERLRARFDQASQARIARDFAALYEFLDPQERELVSQQRFASTEEKLEFVELEVEWVEAIGRLGRVSCLETFRFVDPSATKMGYQKRRAREKWVLRDGEWYFSIME